MTEPANNKTRYMGFKLDMSALENLMKTDGIKPASIKTIRDNYKSIICYVFNKTVPSLQDHGSPENLAKIMEYIKSDQVPWKRKPVMVNSYRKVLGYMKIVIPEGALDSVVRDTGCERMNEFEVDLSDIRTKMEQKKVKENSILTYLTSYKRVIHDVFDRVRPKDDELKSKANMNKLLDYVKSDQVKVGRRAVLVFSYIMVMKAVGIRLGPNNLLVKESKLLKKVADNESQHREYTPKQKQKEMDRYLSTDDLKKLRDKWKGLVVAEFTKADVNYLILSCYCLHVPLRSQCYYDCLYVEDASTKEVPGKIYFDAKTKTLVIDDHKSIKSMGRARQEIDPELCEIFSNFHQKTGSEWLVCNEKKGKYTQSNFSGRLKSLTGIGSNGLRNIFTSEINGNPSIPTSVKKVIAGQMLHTYSTSQLCYTKMLKNGITPQKTAEQIQPVQVEQVQAVQLAPPAEPIQPVQPVEQVPETQTIQPVHPVDEVRRENEALKGRVKTLEEDLRELKDMMKQFLDLKIVLSKISDKVHNSV